MAGYNMERYLDETMATVVAQTGGDELSPRPRPHEAAI
jgi:hypothetical protein